jgi:hypothetical protein
MKNAHSQARLEEALLDSHSGHSAEQLTKIGTFA